MRALMIGSFSNCGGERNDSGHALRGGVTRAPDADLRHRCRPLRSHLANLCGDRLEALADSARLEHVQDADGVEEVCRKKRPRRAAAAHRLARANMAARAPRGMPTYHCNS